MSEVLAYGYEEPNYEVGGINEFEPIKVMFLERNYPSKYLKELDEFNTKKIEEANLLGVDYVEKQPSYKEAGISWTYCIVQRQGQSEGINEKILIPNDEGLLDEPKFTYTGVIQQIPPQQMYEKRWDLGQGGDPHGALYKGSQNPVISRFLPSVWAPYDFKNKRKFDDIPDEENSEEANNCRLQEKIRKENWNSVIKYYNSLQEADALKTLEMSIAYRFCLGNVVDGRFQYVAPHKGMTFEIIRGEVKNRYLELKPYEYLKSEKSYNYFVKNVTPADEEGTAAYIADMIRATRTAGMAKRAKYKSAPDPTF